MAVKEAEKPTEQLFKIPEKGSEDRKQMVVMIVNRWSILWKLLRRRSWRHRPPRGLEMGEGLYLTPGSLVWLFALTVCICIRAPCARVARWSGIGVSIVRLPTPSSLHAPMRPTEASVGHKGQLDESENGTKWFCGTKAVRNHSPVTSQWIIKTSKGRKTSPSPIACLHFLLNFT